MARIHFLKVVIATLTMTSVIGSRDAVAAGHGTTHHGGTSARSHSSSSTRRTASPNHIPGHGSGSLCYNAYWKAATSPNPPRTNQDQNRYWQKYQAWQQYQDRIRK